MCSNCSSLNGRVTSLLLRINNTKDWNKPVYDIRSGGYQTLLKSLQRHFVETGHFVDSLPVMTALGRKVLDCLE